MFRFLKRRSARLIGAEARMASAFGACGKDGVATLALSNLIMLATAGTFWLVLLLRVYRTAKHASCQPDRGRYLLVLGMRLRNGEVTPEYVQRLERARQLLTRDPACKAVLLGGKTGAGPRSEALAGLDYLTARGITPDRVALEDRSRHTLENLREARALLATGNGPAPLLVTSRFHLARSAAIADGLGIQHRLCAAEPELRLDGSTLLHLANESYHLHWYYIGRTWARWTRNGKMLGRIS